MNHGKENKPQRTLTSYGVECLLRPKGVQGTESTEEHCFFLCVPLCPLWFFEPFQKIIKSLSKKHLLPTIHKNPYQKPKVAEDVK
jgi:hypothetical protein